MLYLINPPQWTAIMPPVALNTLVGFLENNQVECKQIDINVLFYNKIMSKKFFQHMNSKLPLEWKETLNKKKIDYNKFIGENIQKATTIMKSEKSILNVQNLQWSTNIVNEYFKILNKYFSPLKISLNEMEFASKANTYDQYIEDIVCNNTYSRLFEVYVDIINKLEIKKNSIVGFSINNFSQLINAYILANILVTKVQGIKMFVGGSYLNAHYKNIVKSKKIMKLFECLCLYDGEHAVLNLYNYYTKGENIIYSNLIFSPRDILNMNKDDCTENIKNAVAPSCSNMEKNLYFSPINICSIPVSRGCYGNCTFCSYNKLVCSKWREQEIDQIIKNIKECQQTYNTNYFFFSVATLSPKMAKELSKEIIKANLNIHWASGIRMEKNFNEETIKLMAKSGCIRLDIGIESASPKVLTSMNKKVDSSYFEEIINNMSKNGILPYLYFIKNYPIEQLKDWEKTLKFLEKVHKKILGFSCYEFYLSPGTTIEYSPEKFGVTIDYNKEDGGVIDTINRFECTFISENTRIEKNILMDRFYNSIKTEYTKYGSAYIKRNLPKTFANQMYYIINQDKVSYPLELSIEHNYKLKADSLIILSMNNNEYTIFCMSTGCKVKISCNLVNLLSKGIDGLSLKYIKHNNTMIFEKISELYRLGVIDISREFIGRE